MKRNLSQVNNPNILITGAGGFIGGHLVSYLKSYYRVFEIFSKTTRKNSPQAISLDLRNKREVVEYFRRFSKDHRIDVVIHLAARMASSNSVRDIKILYDNIKIAENVVLMAKLLKPKKLIHLSSIAVYPNSNGSYHEFSEIRTAESSDCLYGLSKFCGENLFDFFLKDENIFISHLRVAHVYGDGMREDRIIPVMMKELKQKNAITVFGEGERVTNFIHVDKLLSIIHQFIKKDHKGIFNIGDEQMSLLNLAKKLIRSHGSKNSQIIKISNGSRIKFVLDTRKLKRILAKN